MLYGQNLPWRIALRNVAIKQNTEVSGTILRRTIRQHHVGTAHSLASLRPATIRPALGGVARFSTSPSRQKDFPKDLFNQAEITAAEDKKEKKAKSKTESIEEVSGENEVEAKSKTNEASSSSSNASSGSAIDAKGSSAGGAGDSGSGDGGKKGRKGSSEKALQKATVPEVYPQVMAIPITKRPLFPGFYKAVTVRDPNVVAAIQDMMKRGQPYIGAFLFKDDNMDKDVIENIDDVHDVGVFAQITSAFPVHGDDSALTAVLYPHRRIKMSALISPEREGADAKKTESTQAEPPVPEIIPAKSTNEETSEKKGDVVASFEEGTVAQKSAERPVLPYEPISFLRKYPVSLANVENLTEESYDPKSPIIRAVTPGPSVIFPRY